MKLSDALRFLPYVSLISLAIVAVFNIGYFSAIGIHFIGVIDISNLVYSFGLVFPIVTTAIQVSLGPLFDFLKFSKSDNAWEKYRKISLRVVFPSILVAFVALVLATLYWDWRAQNGLVALLLAAMSVNFAASAMMYFRRTEIIDWSDIGWSLATMLIAISYTGRAVAYQQIHDKNNSFLVATKELTLVDVRLVRSSSNGFLVVAAGRIMFIPKDEVRFVRSNRDVN